jgi:WD40 repeat protein
MTAATGAATPPRSTAALRDIPFPGLEPFSENDAAYFFGRERDRKIITSNLEASRLTLLYGASGVGKTSVLLAGVVHELERRAAKNLEARRGTTKPARFATAVCRSWLGDPLARLMELIRVSAEEALGGEELEPWQPGESPVACLLAWTERVRFLYVVLDQFEEYFLYHGPSQEEGSFDVEFVRMVCEPRLRVHFLVSLREDAIALLDRFKAKIPRLLDNYLRVDHLDLESARQAIELPVAKYNELHDGPDVHVEEELIDALLAAPDLRSSRTLGVDAPVRLAQADGGDARIETPYLQLILRRLWLEESKEHSLWLRKRTLDRLGGPRQIVEQHLEAAMDALTGDQQELAVDVFRYLVTPSKSKIAYAPSDLAEHVEKPADDVLALLEKLCEGNRILRRIMTPAEPGGSGATRVRYEIFHDVLAEPILAWRERKTAERTEREERRAAERALHQQIAAQMDEKRQAQAEARKQRLRALVAGVLAVLALGASVLAAVQWSIASNERDKARKERATALSQQWAAQSAASITLDPDASVRDALRALELRETRDAVRALRTALPQSRLRAIVPSRDWATGAAVGGPGGRFVAYTARSGDVRVWDLRTRREAKRLMSPGWQNDTEFAAEGSLLLGSGTGTRVWHMPTCLKRASPTCPPKYSWDSGQTAAISANGRWVVTANGGVAQLHDLRCPRPCNRGPRRETGDWITGLAVNNMGVVAAAVDNGTVWVWEPPTRGGSTHVLRPAWRTATSVALKDDRFLAATGDRSMHVWNLRRCTRRGRGPTSCPVVRVAQHPDWVNSVSFSPEGSQLVTGAEDGIVRVWEPALATPVLELRGHGDTVFDVKFDLSGSHVASASADETLRVWDVSTGTILRGHRGILSGAAFSRDGRRVVTAGSDGTARIYTRSGRQLARLLVSAGRSSRPSPVQGAAFSPDGKTLVTSSSDGYVRAWNVAKCMRVSLCRRDDGEVIGDGRFLGGAPNAVSFSPHAGRSLVAVAANYNGLHIMEVGGETIETAETDPERQTLAANFSADGNRLAVTTTEGVRIWDVSDCYEQSACELRLARSLPRHANVFDVAFSPDGSRLVTAGSDRIARIWNWRQRDRAPVLLRGHTSKILAVRFDKDGDRVVSSGVDGSVRVWDARSGHVLAVFAGRAAALYSVEFAPTDPSVILTASQDGTARIIRCPVEWCGPLHVVRKRAEEREEKIHRPPQWLPGDGP